jgi:hypothetical protein
MKDLGVKDVFISDTHDIKLVNTVIDGLVSAKNYGLPMPESVLFSNQITRNLFKDESDLVPAAFLEPSKSPIGKTTLLINKKSPYWIDPIKESINDYADWTASTGRVDHLILHESAHLESFNKGIVKESLSPLIFEKAKDVSNIAARNNLELIAEMRVGLIF